MLYQGARCCQQGSVINTRYAKQGKSLTLGKGFFGTSQTLQILTGGHCLPNIFERYWQDFLRVFPEKVLVGATLVFGWILGKRLPFLYLFGVLPGSLQ